MASSSALSFFFLFLTLFIHSICRADPLKNFIQASCKKIPKESYNLCLLSFKSFKAEKPQDMNLSSLTYYSMKLVINLGMDIYDKVDEGVRVQKGTKGSSRLADCKDFYGVAVDSITDAVEYFENDRYHAAHTNMIRAARAALDCRELLKGRGKALFILNSLNNKYGELIKIPVAFIALYDKHSSNKAP